MSVIVGIDPSMDCGMARTEGDDCVGKRVSFPEERGYRRLQLIAQEVTRVLEVWKPDVVIIEDYIVGHPSSAVSVIEAGSNIRHVLYQLGFWWYVVYPSTLKKWTTGKGNAKKPDMAKAALLRWGVRSPSDDIIDAICLAKLGQALQADPFLVVNGVNKDGKVPS